MLQDFQVEEIAVLELFCYEAFACEKLIKGEIR
jgi:hypothetical protein